MKKPEEWLQLVIETVISDSFSSRSQSSEPVRQLIEAIQQDARSDDAGLVALASEMARWMQGHCGVGFTDDIKRTDIIYKYTALQSARKDGGE
jgi:hypothetical protein